MKFMSASCTAAVLLGISALIHPSVSLALPTCAVCDGWYAECHRDPRSAACKSWEALCRDCRPDAAVSGTPPSKHDDTSSMVVMNSRRGDIAATQAKYTQAK